VRQKSRLDIQRTKRGECRGILCARKEGKELNSSRGSQEIEGEIERAGVSSNNKQEGTLQINQGDLGRVSVRGEENQLTGMGGEIPLRFTATITEPSYLTGRGGYPYALKAKALQVLTEDVESLWDARGGRGLDQTREGKPRSEGDG